VEHSLIAELQSHRRINQLREGTESGQSRLGTAITEFEVVWETTPGPSCHISVRSRRIFKRRNSLPSQLAYHMLLWKAIEFRIHYFLQKKRAGGQVANRLKLGEWFSKRCPVAILERRGYSASTASRWWKIYVLEKDNQWRAAWQGCTKCVVLH
jgi:hypothetical protein